MKTLLSIFFVIILSACGSSEKKSDLEFKTELSKPLKEISGIAAEENLIWAITDKPQATVYKLDNKGKVDQQINVTNVEAVDVEAVTSDDNFVYIGDLGDNEGNREQRQIIKIAKSAIKGTNDLDLEGEIIRFTFSDSITVDKKKQNNYDCESFVSFGDSLYLFTKRREDMQTELFVIPKTPGTYAARSLGTYDSEGLVTDAALNKANNELALTGYRKGHKHPFILLFKNFKGNNFFSGASERIELADKGWDWQIESISFDKENKMYFACEETKEVKSTLYIIARDKLEKLNKGKKKL